MHCAVLLTSYSNSSYSSFRPGRSCVIDETFSVRPAIEKNDNGRDFRRRSQSVWLNSQTRATEIFGHYRLATNIVTFIQKHWEESNSSFTIDRETSSWFELIPGVCQGCILLPLVFASSIRGILKKENHRSSAGSTVWSKNDQSLKQSIN